MKNLNKVIIVTTLAVLAFAVVGVALASTINNSPYFGGMMGYSTPSTTDDWWTEMQDHMEDHWNQIRDEDWWTEMREYMDDHWNEVQDEEWFNDMRAYMNEHFDEVKNQPWYDEMIQFMEDRWESQEYRYQYNNTPRSYGRGCWGW